MRGRSFPPVRTQSKIKLWHEADKGVRLAHDRALVAESYPCLEYRIDEPGQVYLEGQLTFVAECGIPTQIPLRITFPWNYPSHEPRVYDVEDRFPHIADRHFYPDGQCCLWLPPESRWDKNDPLGIRRFLDEVAVFFDRQLVYDAQGSGIWPGQQRSHGVRGYIEFVLETLGDDEVLLTTLAPIFANLSIPGRNSPCPCGSNRKYKLCHLNTVEDITRRIGVRKSMVLQSSQAELGN